MHKEKKDKNFIKKPFYEGGTKAMRIFLKKHMRYPKEAMEAEIEGTVVVKYSIDYRGKVVDARVVSGLGYGCDEEALRLVKKLKYTVPKSRKVKVLFHKDLQIHFRLPKQKGTVISYSYSSKQEAEESQPQKGNSYNYTINF